MTRGIDHLVVAVRDLDAAARLYERLGFTVGARNRHPWGTENRVIQLAGSFIELISVGEDAGIPPHEPRRFSFGAFVRDYLAVREGLAMLVLDSADSKADAAAFAADGIGDFEPFFFERRGRRPDGAETHVAFTLAFAQDPAAERAGFFLCQHHFPENFWNESFQRHPNRASALSAVTLAAPEPPAHEAFLTRFTGVEPSSPDGDDLSYTLARGRIDVVTPDDAAEIYGSVDADPAGAAFVAFAVRIPNPQGQAALLTEGGIPYQTIGSRLVVPASAAHGVTIAFEPE
ncbi:MAG TPA: VOC family protein [Microvirga sp.]|jgi:catechol 2,3-dioxygenase-like lactoylglutathione lyase family enzyme|nr:VOC family protein [Microvirga sp.]